MTGRPNCVAGCGRPVQRTGAHCAECRKRVRAAQARVRRGADLLPSISGATAQEVLTRLNAARDNLDRLESSREHAERERGLDSLPFGEVDLWTRAVRAELTAATQALADWAITARDIQAHGVKSR